MKANYIVRKYLYHFAQKVGSWGLTDTGATKDVAVFLNKKQESASQFPRVQLPSGR